LLKGLTRGSMGFPAVGGLKPHPTHRWIHPWLQDCATVKKPPYNSNRV
jgi:hypothetical protein